MVVSIEKPPSRRQPRTASWSRRLAGPGVMRDSMMADGPAVTVEHLAGRDSPPAHRGLPVDVGRRQLDLAEDDVDHPVEELFLVGDVVVERHRACAELVCELAHRQRFEPVARGERDGGSQHALLAQPRSRLGGWFWSAHRWFGLPPLLDRTVYEYGASYSVRTPMKEASNAVTQSRSARRSMERPAPQDGHPRLDPLRRPRHRRSAARSARTTSTTRRGATASPSAAT